MTLTVGKKSRVRVGWGGLLPKTTSDGALLVANAGALATAIAGGWGMRHLLWLFALETVVIGALNVPRILTAAGKAPPAYGETPQGVMADAMWKLFFSAFFCLHFGGFTATQFAMLVFLTFGSLKEVGPLFALLTDLRWPLLFLTGSHAVSFLTNYLPRERYDMLPYECMARPYGRILLFYPAMGLGALAANFLGEGSAALSVAMLLKVTVDLEEHKRERKLLVTSKNRV
jgi:hypothetical protein